MGETTKEKEGTTVSKQKGKAEMAKSYWELHDGRLDTDPSRCPWNSHRC